MTKDEKLKWMQRNGFAVSIVSKNIIRAQKYGIIVTGTIPQVYEEVKIYGHKKRGGLAS